MLEEERYPPHWAEHSLSHEQIEAEFLVIMAYFE
jgi:hypothetical protein